MRGIADAAAIILEIWIVYAWHLQLLPPEWLLVAHAVGVLIYVFVSGWIVGCATGSVAFRAAILFLIGPLVAIGVVVRLSTCWLGTKDTTSVGIADVGGSELDRSQTANASAAEAVYAQIVAGRRPRRDRCRPHSLLKAVESGELETQQFAIAIISQRYEPEMFHALTCALKSATPAVRVQAAAVYAKLRERSQAEARTILETSDRLYIDAAAGYESRRLAVAERCRRLANSGFVDDEICHELRQLADSLQGGGSSEPQCGSSKPGVAHVGDPAGCRGPAADSARLTRVSSREDRRCTLKLVGKEPGHAL